MSLLQQNNFVMLLHFIFFLIFSLSWSCVTAAVNTTLLQAANANANVAADEHANTNTTTTQLLSRKRRYVAFPDGSSVSAAICLTIGVIGNPNVAYLSWAENWGVAYNLPNYTWAKQNAHGFSNDIKDTKAVVLRRSRRDLYDKLEILIENMGISGQACIARALCESSKYLQQYRKQRGNMLMEIVKKIFSFPTERVYAHEPEIIHQYDRIYRRSHRDVHDCSVEYGECHFSLLEMAFGKYSVPPTKHGTAQMVAAGKVPFM